MMELQNKKLLEGKAAVVTGAAGGIGRAVALSFAREGAALCLLDTGADALKAVAAEAEATGARVLSFCADVADSAAVKPIIAQTAEAFGGIDILANIAGIWGHHLGVWTEFADSDESTWNTIIRVNLIGTMVCSRAVLDYMIRAGRGKILTTGSVAGVNGLPKMVDYSAAKGGVIAFTKALATEVGKHGIQVNCISPGSIDTHNGGPPTLLGRLGSPGETAELYLFLASGKSDFITGQNYIIDGGRTLSTRW